MKKPIIPDKFSHFESDWHFSPGIDTGEFIFFSGITGAHPDLSVSHKPEQQFRDAFDFLCIYLDEAKLTLDDIVEMTTYHVDLKKHIDVFIKVKDDYIKKPYPAWSAIGVSELITDGTLIEIRVIAHRSKNNDK